MSSESKVLQGDCLQRMAELPAESIDSIVTDPPYGLSFMGKEWDHGVPGVEFWKEALRVAKPGCHLLAFGGTRTYHRLACAIEDAGWEIRDCVMWVYGSGFPKSLDVSKAIDKVNGEAERLHKFTAWMRTTGVSASQINIATSTNMGGHYLTSKSQPAIPTPEIWKKIRPLCGDVPLWVDQLVDRIEAERKVVGKGTSGTTAIWASDGGMGEFNITAPSTPEAQQWNGWGTALKPAWEPIIVARKPLIGTVANNVLKHGTGAINVDGCRVETEDKLSIHKGNLFAGNSGIDTKANFQTSGQSLGRFPANVIHDGSDEVLERFPETKGDSPKRKARQQKEGSSMFGIVTDGYQTNGFKDKGSAARFFYCAKASKKDRGEANGHPTVKPTALMRYLCKLVTPPNGLVLDPFCGSGSTGKGAVLEGFRFLGIEREQEYVEIATARIKAAQTDKDELEENQPLLPFDGNATA